MIKQQNGTYKLAISNYVSFRIIKRVTQNIVVFGILIINSEKKMSFFLREIYSYFPILSKKVFK